VLRESHEPDFQDKLASSRVSNVQVSKKKFVANGTGEKIILQEIVELPEDVTMVDCEVTTLKKDFDDLFEGTNKRHSNRCLDLSLESHQPSSSRFDFFFEALGKTSCFNSLGGP
jgi:hypothetical protein